MKCWKSKVSNQTFDLAVFMLEKTLSCPTPPLYLSFVYSSNKLRQVIDWMHKKLWGLCSPEKHMNGRNESVFPKGQWSIANEWLVSIHFATLKPSLLRVKILFTPECCLVKCVEQLRRDGPASGTRLHLFEWCCPLITSQNFVRI